MGHLGEFIAARVFTVLAREWASVGRDHAGLILIWSLTNAQHKAIVDGVQRRLSERPEQAEWVNLALTV